MNLLSLVLALIWLENRGNESVFLVIFVSFFSLRSARKQKDRRGIQLDNVWKVIPTKNLPAFLQLSLLTDAESTDDSLRAELARVVLQLADVQQEVERLQKANEEKETRIQDQQIRIRVHFLVFYLYKNSFQSLEFSTTPSTSVEDVSRLRQELVAKDTRIVDLNNELIGKEHKIIELQEGLRDARQLLETKNRAFTIVQQQLNVCCCKCNENALFSSSQSFTNKRYANASTGTLEGADEFGYFEPAHEMQRISAAEEAITAGPGQARLQLPVKNVTSATVNTEAPDEDSSTLSDTPGTSTTQHLPEMSEDFDRPLYRESPLTVQQQQTSSKGSAKKGKRVTFDLPPSPTDEQAATSALLALKTEFDEYKRKAELRLTESQKKFQREHSGEVTALHEEVDELTATIRALEAERDELIADNDQMTNDISLQEKLYEARVEQVCVFRVFLF